MSLELPKNVVYQDSHKDSSGAITSYACTMRKRLADTSPNMANQDMPPKKRKRAEASGAEQSPAESPIKPPTETPNEFLCGLFERPIKSPIKPPAESPIKSPAESPIKPPTESSNEFLCGFFERPINSPAESPAEPPTESPAEPPTESPAEPPAEPKAQLHSYVKKYTPESGKDGVMGRMVKGTAIAVKFKQRPRRPSNAFERHAYWMGRIERVLRHKSTIVMVKVRFNDNQVVNFKPCDFDHETEGVV